MITYKRICGYPKPATKATNDNEKGWSDFSIPDEQVTDEMFRDIGEEFDESDFPPRYYPGCYEG
jgi:hypothetical protein